MNSSAYRKFLVRMLAGGCLVVGLCGALSHAQLTILGPGDTFVIEPGGDPIPGDGIAVSGGTLIIRDDADFTSPLQLLMVSGVISVESGTVTMDTFDGTTIAGGIFDLQASARLHVTSDSITIRNGVEFSKAGAFGPGPEDFIETFTINTGGSLTHPPRYEPGLFIEAADLSIDIGGMINVNGKGLLGGEAYDDFGQIVAGAPADPIRPPGGSYAGSGEDGDSTVAAHAYGYMEDAELLGAGGGARGAVPGHPGGGRVTLVALNFLDLSGDILAEGEDSVDAGAGSGGSVRIYSNELEDDSTAVISVRGGWWSSNGSGGGGGRVYTENLGPLSFDGLVHFDGGGYAGAGSFGRDNIYFVGGATGHTRFRSNLPIVGAIVLGNVEISPADTPHLSVAGVVYINGVVTITENSSLPLHISADNIDINSSIDCSGRGPVGGGHPLNPHGDAGQTVGADGLSWIAGSTGGAGGSYGGIGGGVGPNTVYGSSLDARYVGSSGSRSSGTGEGGAGGGHVWLEADSCTIDGPLRADGGAGTPGDGSGSGGSIRLDCPMLDGSGVISANGGTGTGFSGGGGRIVIRANENPSDIPFATVSGHTPGSLVVNDTRGPVVTGVALHGSNPPSEVSAITISLSEATGTAVDFSAVSVVGASNGALSAASVTTNTSSVLVSFGGLMPMDVYTLTLNSGVDSGSVHDSAGTPMNGEFFGFFPSGDYFPGGNFVYEFVVDIDTDADGTGDLGDNCVAVVNPSQSDLDGDGVGDACEAKPSFLVSSVPSDLPDFSTIGAALAQVTLPDTTIRIMPGYQTAYLESVTIDSLVHLIGVGEIRPAIGGNWAVTVDSGISGTVRLENLWFSGGSSGAYSVLARSDTALENITFGGYASGMVLEQGSHFATGIDTYDPPGLTKPRTFDLHDGASLEIEYSDLRDAGDAIWVRGGSLTVSHTVIADNIDGIVYPVSANPAASVTVRHSTIAGNVRGINSVDDLGHAPIVEYSVISGNSLSMLRVSCANVTNSNIEGGCTAPTNITSPAGFIGASNYRLLSTSPAIDYAAAPAAVACVDLDNNPRLQDGEGDGINQIDLGAYEYASASALPAQVETAMWLDGNSLTWDSTPGAAEYHVYRGTVSTLSSSLGVCQDFVDANTSDTFFVDPEIPPSGESFTYLIGAENGSGVEGTIGMTSCAERVATQCP